MKWKIVQLQSLASDEKGSIVSGPFGSNISAKYFVDEGIPVIRGNNLTKGEQKFIDDGFVYLTETKASEFRNCIAIENDLVFTAAGSIGQVGIIPDNTKFKKYVVSNKQIRVRINEKKANPLFVYYWLSSRKMTIYLEGMNNGGAVPLINLGIIRKVPVPLPLIDTQNNICTIISNLNDLIDTNRRRIQLLEESARLLFREWFVSFRFPGHEKVKIVDIDGRKMPGEWNYMPIVKIEIFKKAPLGVSVFTDTRQYYQTSEIDGTSISGIGEEVDYENRPSRANIAPRINTVYFAKMKDTDKVLCFDKGNSYLLEKILLSTGMTGFTTDEKYLGFLFGLLTSYEFIQYKNNFATGATQVSLNDASLKKIKVLFSTLNLVELYSEIVNPLLEECSLLRRQNQKLAQARDLLLPRLMSGAIEV